MLLVMGGFVLGGICGFVITALMVASGGDR